MSQICALGIGSDESIREGVLRNHVIETPRNRIDYTLDEGEFWTWCYVCLLYTSPSPRDLSTSRMPSSA